MANPQASFYLQAEVGVSKREYCGVVTQEIVRATGEHRLEVHLRLKVGARKYSRMVGKWARLQTRQQRECPFLWLFIEIAFSHETSLEGISEPSVFRCIVSRPASSKPSRVTLTV